MLTKQQRGRQLRAHAPGTLVPRTDTRGSASARDGGVAMLDAPSAAQEISCSRIP